MSKKFLITGVSGFVGRHFLDWLEGNKIHSQVLGIDHSIDGLDSAYSYVEESFEQVDLMCGDEIERVLTEFQPDYVLHLAACSSVAFSWKEPVRSFQNNMNVFLNLVEAVRKLGLTSRILSVGSSEVYGNINQDQLPLKEGAALDPVSPYAVARVSQELLSKVYADAYGIDLVMTRSFNHIGPRQKDVFVISAFARQIAELKKKGALYGTLQTGDLEIVRDFVDVRDVVRAYYLLLTQGEKGRIYNICSGTGRSLREVLNEVASLAGVEIKTEVNPDFIRPSDNRVIVGSNQRLREELGWIPEIPLERSLRDILNYWEELA